MSEGPVDIEGLPQGLLPGIARAGVDYRPVQGKVTFAPGQTAAAVEIPLIDNGLVDGARDFEIWITEWPPGQPFANWQFESFGWIRIEDNELGSSLDPLFAPPIAVAQPDGEYLGLPGTSPAPALYLFPLSRGRVLTGGGSLGVIVLESDGREDLKFAINLGRQGFPRLTPLAGLADDGVIAFVDFQDSDQGHRAGRLVRLNGDGTFGAAFVIPGYSDFVGVQRSGRILVTTLGEQGQQVLVGYDKNGGPDAGFRRLAFSPGVERGSVQIDSEDRIVVLSRESDGRVVLGRFDPDGALDPGFAAPVLTGRPTWQFIRRDGRIVIGGLEFGGMMQLGINGAATEGTPASVSFHGVYPPDLGDQWVPRFEGTDGKLRGATLLSAGLGALVEWNPDGTLAGRFIRIRAMPYYSCCFGGFLVPQLAPSGVGPLVGYVNTIEGMPCRGLARLLVNPSERDFRVLAPAEISASNGNARLRVSRTGPTSETASIHYRTRDGDAIAGREYEETSGVLVFAPLEVSKEVVVPLKADAAISGRRSFDLQLEAPSGGYGVIPTTPVVLVPALSLECRRADPVVLTVRGTLPGATYALESSEDLVSWQRSDPVTALDSSLELAGDQVPAWSRKSMFYRIAR